MAQQLTPFTTILRDSSHQVQNTFILKGYDDGSSTGMLGFWTCHCLVLKKQYILELNLVTVWWHPVA
jgi:hypothetical protein